MMIEKVDLNLNLDDILSKVLDNKENWIDRGYFHTFGAAAYIDKPNDYSYYVNKYNPILKKEFGNVIDVLCDHFSAELHPEIALPGFHIFDKRGNGRRASIHQDVSFRNLPIFDHDNKDGKSFTIAIKKPQCGAGLNVWDNDYNKSYCDYDLGCMYVHHSGLRHQIASVGSMKKDEQRITMQGHIITFKENTYIYF